MARCDPDVIEPSAKIEFGVDVHAFELVNKIQNERYRVLVLLCDAIQPSVVNTYPQ